MTEKTLKDEDKQGLGAEHRPRPREAAQVDQKRKEKKSQDGDVKQKKEKKDKDKDKDKVKVRSKDKDKDKKKHKERDRSDVKTHRPAELRVIEERAAAQSAASSSEVVDLEPVEPPVIEVVALSKDDTDTAEPARKRLKAWQDDELEVESDEEGTASKMDALRSVAQKSLGNSSPDAPKTDELEEPDPLDAFMAELANESQTTPGKETPVDTVAFRDGLGVLDSSRVTSITMEEIEALSFPSKAKGSEEPGAQVLGQPAETTDKGAESDEGDDAFHAAFIAEMKLQRRVPFEARASFAGQREGYVFKLGKLGLGYYLDERVAQPPKADMCESSGDESDAAPALETPAKETLPTVEADVVGGAMSPRPEPVPGTPEPLDLLGTPVPGTPEALPVSTPEALPGPSAPSGAKVVLSKKERRKLRREAKMAEAEENEEAGAKKAAKPPKGIPEEERMESDPDRSEESSESEEEGYFDLMKRFTTKKTLPAVNHSAIDYKAFKKNFYIQVKEITLMKDHEVEDLRKTHGDIRIRGKNCPRPIKSFLQCGLPEKVIRILNRREYEMPFPIQMQAIPALMCGRDLIGVAQTGSGKTLAYVLPMIRHAMDQPCIADGDGPICFIIAPTRELALQIQREVQIFCKATGMRSVCAFGGGPMGEQLSALKKGCEFLIGTPGRLIDVLTTSNGKITNLRRVTFCVLDEADRMFDMGFEPQIGMFLQGTREDKQVAMFSATLPLHVEALARTVLKKPLEIIVGERNTAATNVTQFVEVLEEGQKFYRLLQLLGEWHEHGAVIIFVHQQRDVDELFTELLKYGYPSLALHGGQDQHDRDFTLQDFKDGVAQILIATSVAARGIDVKQVILVINFKVPDHLEDYIHRIGRTGRAGKTGFAYTFVQPDEADRAQDMIDALRQCNQKVSDKLRLLAEEHQSQVNLGNATKKRRWGGFGGKGFKYDGSEKSRQQRDRQQAKKDMLIGTLEDLQEKDEFKDPWMDDKPLGPSNPQQAASNDPQTTAALAAQRAAQMQADTPLHGNQNLPYATVAVPGVGNTPAGTALSPAVAQNALAPVAPLLPPPLPTKVIGRVTLRRTDREIETQARKMAEQTLKNLSEEQRQEQLPKLFETLKAKLKKENQEQAKMPPPTPPKPPPDGVMKAVSVLPGVLTPVPLGGDGMVYRSLEQLQTGLSRTPASLAGTAKAAADMAMVVSGQLQVSPVGTCQEELEINDYPTIARQKISHKEPLLAIEEMTGARCQVKGQYFAPNAPVPDGARRLFVEIIGPTSVSVSKAKQEVRRMMEALAIRTLNIPGMSRAVMGQPGRYDPLVGK